MEAGANQRLMLNTTTMPHILHPSTTGGATNSLSASVLLCGVRNGWYRLGRQASLPSSTTPRYRRGHPFEVEANRSLVKPVSLDDGMPLLQWATRVGVL